MNITKFIVGLAVACTITACGQVNEILPEVNMDFPAIIIKQEFPREMVLVNPWNPVPEDYEADLIHVTNGYYVDKQCYDALNEMLDACREAGNRPLICSAYRSYNTQTWLYNRKVNQFIGYGYSRQTAEVRAAEIVAVPGTSEHQLGLSVDIVDSRNQTLNSSQENTDTQKWLMENCWDYGFILRYPTNKSDITGIIYEPWHYRYVGTETSLAMRDSGLCYEEYLGVD